MYNNNCFGGNNGGCAMPANNGRCGNGCGCNHDCCC